ncbi:MAG TPA: hypothetical protein VF546_10180 [Pyrinomonadaceae bacterium]
MSTASTKSQRRKAAARQKGGAQKGAPAPAAPEATAATLSPRAWQLASGAILLGATLLRVFRLGLNPLHHDEGVNGFFLVNLMRSGVYHYDPANYHGPTLYYFALPLTYPLDHYHALDTWALRLVTAAFGVGVVWLTLRLRSYLGAFGALAAAALLAVSPGMVYNSRYFIHEMLFVFFTLGIVVAAGRFYEDGAGQTAEEAGRRAPPAQDWPSANLWGLLAVAGGLVLAAATLGAVYRPASFTYYLLLLLVALVGTVWALWAYDGPRASYLLVGTASAALLFATKETAFISAVTLVLAALIGWWYVWAARRLRAPQNASARKKGRAPAQPVAAWPAFVARSGGYAHLALLLAAAVGIFLFVNIVYYSSFFTNPKGVTDALATFRIWAETGKSDFHKHPVTTYLHWLWQEEAAVLLLGVLGTLVALWRGRSRFAVFAAAWAWGITLAYSLVNYKTPWLQLNMVLPLALVAGYGLERLYRHGTRRAHGHWLAHALLGAALCLALYQTYQINFVHYDDDRYTYVYAHTQRPYLQLIAQVDDLSRRAGSGFETTIDIASPDYWPMPWYLRDYKHVGYSGRVTTATNASLVVINVNDTAQAQALLGAKYREVGTYNLRPGVILALYARRDLAG